MATTPATLLKRAREQGGNYPVAVLQHYEYVMLTRPQEKKKQKKTNKKPQNNNNNNNNKQTTKKQKVI